jgi:hypothetical protein
MAAHTGSAYLSTKKAIEEAEDRGFDAGRDYWISEGIRLAIEMHERDGDFEAAKRLREAKIVKAGE